MFFYILIIVSLFLFSRIDTTLKRRQAENIVLEKEKLEEEFSKRKQKNIKMITPSFKLTQNNEFLFIEIKASYAKVIYLIT